MNKNGKDGQGIMYEIELYLCKMNQSKTPNKVMV